jgi:DinB superfamily
MSLSKQTAKHFREAHFGGNWTAVNLKDSLADVSWQQAVTKVHSFNTIAALVYHLNYYTVAVLNVLRGTPIAAHDKYSFDLPPVTSQQDWDSLVAKTFADAEALAALAEALPEGKLSEDFYDNKYGSYFRNLIGITEHLHYHLGQIVLIKKLLPADGL